VPLPVHNTDALDWSRGVQDRLTRENLLDLADGGIPAICVDGFLEDAAAEAILQAYSRLVHDYYDYYRDVVPRIAKCGPTVFEHQFAARERYFAEAGATKEQFAAALDGMPSPLEILQFDLRDRCGLSSRLATDRAFGDYFAGTLRSIENGTPVHIDFAPFESPGWEMISSVDAQLAANVYLDPLPAQGALTIYRRLWSPEDERYRFGDRFGYEDAVVGGTPHEVIASGRKTLVLFNSRCFHRVGVTGRRRLTYSFFLAFQDDELIFWS
jgi:hypothetical protein